MIIEPLCMLLLVYLKFIKTIRLSMVKKLHILFEMYDLMHHVLAFVKGTKITT
jgi:hypothetical protein